MKSSIQCKADRSHNLMSSFFFFLTEKSMLIILQGSQHLLRGLNIIANQKVKLQHDRTCKWIFCCILALYYNLQYTTILRTLSISLAQLTTNSSHPSRVWQEIIFFSPQMPQLYTSSQSERYKKGYNITLFSFHIFSS